MGLNTDGHPTRIRQLQYPYCTLRGNVTKASIAIIEHCRSPTYRDGTKSTSVGHDCMVIALGGIQLRIQLQPECLEAYSLCWGQAWSNSIP
jgi:hypothetical protein